MIVPLSMIWGLEYTMVLVLVLVLVLALEPAPQEWRHLPRST